MPNRLIRAEETAFFSGYYARECVTAVRRMESRPSWPTKAEDALKEAKKSIELALAAYEDLPIEESHEKAKAGKAVQAASNDDSAAASTTQAATDARP